MERPEESFLGSTPAMQLPEIHATNGGTVNLTIIIADRREEDSLRRWAEKILQGDGGILT